MYSWPKPEEPEKLGIRMQQPHLRSMYLRRVRQGSPWPWGPPWTITTIGFFSFLNYYSVVCDYRQYPWMGSLNSSMENYSLARGGRATILPSSTRRQKKLLWLWLVRLPVMRPSLGSQQDMPQDQPVLFSDTGRISPDYRLMSLILCSALSTVWKYAQGIPSLTKVSVLIVQQLPIKASFTRWISLHSRSYPSSFSCPSPPFCFRLSTTRSRQQEWIQSEPPKYRIQLQQGEILANMFVSCFVIKCFEVVLLFSQPSFYMLISKIETGRLKQKDMPCPNQVFLQPWQMNFVPSSFANMGYENTYLLSSPSILMSMGMIFFCFRSQMKMPTSDISSQSQPRSGAQTLLPDPPTKQLFALGTFFLAAQIHLSLFLLSLALPKTASCKTFS